MDSWLKQLNNIELKNKHYIKTANTLVVSMILFDVTQTWQQHNTAMGNGLKPVQDANVVTNVVKTE